MQVRSLVLWIATLPFVLAGAMSPISIALWVSLIVYIFVGIEEVGVQVEHDHDSRSRSCLACKCSLRRSVSPQVEQPFEIVPMTALCNIIMANLQEAISAPPDEMAAIEGLF